MDRATKIKAYSAALVFSVSIGFTFLAIKICIPVASPLEILVFRYDFALIGSLIPVVSKFVKVELSGKDNKALFIAAALYIGFMIFQTIGLMFSTSIESAIIFAIIPIMAKIIASIFLGEKSSLTQNIFVCLSVSALILMIIMGAANISMNLFGVVILIFSSLCMAGSNVLVRYARKDHKPYAITVVIAVMGCAAFNAAYLVHLAMQGDIMAYFAPCANAGFVIATAYLGIPCLVISSWLMSFMLAHMEAVKATIFGNLSTAISIVAGIIILKEPMYFYHVICTAAIVVGVVGVSVSKTKENS